MGKQIICGKCSKEQSTSISECSGCKEGLRGKGRVTSHWEGGKGIRDQGRMSKKDTKKYAGRARHRERQWEGS